jgi:hypothetical protein
MYLAVRSNDKTTRRIEGAVTMGEKEGESGVPERLCQAVWPNDEPCDYPATVHCAKCGRWFGGSVQGWRRVYIHDLEWAREDTCRCCAHGGPRYHRAEGKRPADGCQDRSGEAFEERPRLFSQFRTGTLNTSLGTGTTKRCPRA